MSISISENRKRFHLTDGATFSRVLAVIPDEDARLNVEELYFGPALPENAADVLEDTRQKMFSNAVPNDVTMRGAAFYLCPTAGNGDVRPAALQVQEPDGTWSTELSYEGYALLPGKPKLEGLPAAYAEQVDEAETLELLFRDRKTGLEVKLYQCVMNAYHALTSWMVVENGGDEKLVLQRCMSATVHLSGNWDMLHLHGAWAKERQVERIPNMHGTRAIGSVRGASSHQHNPFVAMMEPGADEHQGRVLGVNLVYSGSFLMEADQNEHDLTRLVAGIAPCAWTLEPDGSFTTPETVMVWSEQGLNGMSQIFHKLYRERLCRGVWRDRLRPVLCNNWEGTYFDFDEERILAIARTAAELGVELFVLDDGWFGQRNDDTTSLGDWQVNRDKLPNGIAGLSEKLHQMGLMFGLWVEPEMISPVSKLYEEHPDWCLHAPARSRTLQRHQLILDLTRRDVQDWMIDTITGVLREGSVDYVKWDMNRNFAQIGSALLQPAQQSETPHRYMLGLYRVMEAVTSALPDVLFEACASGGGRFDPGILYYMPQVWTSDDTDAVERLNIQYGTSMAYPISSMGAHVSAVPNHQVGRVTSMRFRGDVALGGNMGYELDLSRQSEADKAEIRRQVEQVKQLRRITQRGRFTRLQSPFDNRIAAWQFALEDDSEILVCLFQRYTAANPPQIYVRVRDIDESALYRDQFGREYSGAVLSKQGLRSPFGWQPEKQDQESLVLHLTRI